jgi:solute carrier family 25 carnitine/acylcarnitine transporter 20/29
MPFKSIHTSNCLSSKNTSLTTEKSDNMSATLSKGGTTVEEGVFGLACGLVYGVTSPLVGHPFDTIKTKMQAQEAYMHTRSSMFQTFRTVIRNEGFLSLYKGLLPPLFGSSIFRAVQFGVYNAAYTELDDYPIFKSQIPYTGGLETRVVVAGMLSASVRSVIECPLELIKVRKQVNEQWNIRSLFNGFTVTWVRTLGLMTTFFILVDTLVRHAPDLVNRPVVGPFVKGGVCSTASWLLVWPFETLKSQIQAGTPGPNTISSRFVYVLKNGGASGLFRGCVPGCTRSLIANGASMIMFSKCQDLRESYEKRIKQRQL